MNAHKQKLNIFQNIKIPFEKKAKPTIATIKYHQHFYLMFIKDLIYNYNVQELLSTTSILVFALDAWVALNLSWN